MAHMLFYYLTINYPYPATGPVDVGRIFKLLLQPGSGNFAGMIE
jgi:hypothetical protein